MPGHYGDNSPSNIIGYDGQGRPIYRTHGNGTTNGNGVRNGNGMRNGMRNNTAATTRAANQNPVTRTFFAPQSPRYFRPNGQIVPIGAPLHQHLDGTIMTEHSMGPNDNSVVVTTSSPSSTPNRTRTSRTARATRAPRINMGNRTSNRFGQRGGTSYGASSGE